MKQGHLLPPGYANPLQEGTGRPGQTALGSAQHGYQVLERDAKKDSLAGQGVLTPAPPEPLLVPALWAEVGPSPASGE